MFPSWSHDGNWIYFTSAASGRNEIWKLPGSGGGPVQLTRNGGFAAFESPDGKTIYYTKTDNHATLFRSALDGTGETAVLDGVERRGFVIAADRIYYLSEKPDSSIVIRRHMLATGGDSEIAPAGRHIYLGLSISPDGRYLIYSQNRFASNLMLVDPDQ
jgi:Tol biopolymer transport system component